MDELRTVHDWQTLEGGARAALWPPVDRGLSHRRPASGQDHATVLTLFVLTRELTAFNGSR